VITATELAQRIEAGSPPFVLDVRSPQEYAQGHIPGAVNIPYDVLSARVSELGLTKSEEIVVLCQVGRRAQLAESTLREIGFTNVRDLEGHWQAWQAARLPSE
jgi:rhodanese-related sulfurtransferase